jgi:ribonucleoside-diphosphate reductase alpha chain
VPATKIVKRTGEVVSFDRGRIRQAVAKAIRAVGTDIETHRLDVVVDRVVAEVDERFTDFFPNVENIQDIVEKHLVREGFYEIAKAYILYRADRQRERDAAKAQVIEKARVGRLTVQTRDGRVVLFNLKKCEESLSRLAGDLGADISIDRVVQEAMRTVFDGIPTTQIERSLVLAAAAFIEQDPAYSYLAARLQLEALFKEVTGQSLSESPEDRDTAYRMSFTIAIRNALDTGLFDKQMQAFDLHTLAAALKPERDWLFQYLGIQTLADRYLARHDGRCVELPQAFWMRVAMGLAINEADKTARAIEFYDLMSELRYVPSTPTLFHAGTPHPQLSSCYLTTINDDLSHIFKALADNAQLSKWSGGLGNDWTNVRGTGSRIKSTKVESQGVVPFLKVANDVTMAINRSGKRRGATCAYLETWHYDIEDFLDLRRNTGDERRRTHDMNTANWIPDLFMKRVIADGPWTLFSPDETPDLHHLYGRAFDRRYEEYEARAARGEMYLHKTVQATALWRKMLTMLFETGHPWITFKDPCNIRSPQDHVGVVHSSNLCTEITLNTSADETAVCNLGSVNLARHIVDGKLDEAQIARTVATAIRMLDNVIDINYYPTVEAKSSNMRHRPIGLGIMGFQDALFLVNAPYDSPEAIELSDRTMELISYHAILNSSKLAQERGAYETYQGSKWSRGILPADTLDLLERERGMPIDVSRARRLDWAPVYDSVKTHGMRNSNTMAVAPTATIANIAGCYPCIEPIYKNIYVKANISGEFTVVNDYLVRDLKALGLWTTEMLDQLKYFDGNVQMIAGIPDHLKAKYREAFEIDPHVALQLTAARGKWIDQSQSHNVFVKGTSGRKLSEVYLTAWRLGLKTTYYLRTLAASQIEKSTLDASKYGFTQKRDHMVDTPSPAPVTLASGASAGAVPAPASLAPVSVASGAAGAAAFAAGAGAAFPAPASGAPSASDVPLCRIDDPDCEACQ